MKKLIIKLILAWFRKQSREIVKLDAPQELYHYRLADPAHTIKLLKSLMTTCTVLHFEAKNDEERVIMKGGALILKAILQGNQKAEKIIAEKVGLDKQTKAWTDFKQIFKY